MFTAKAKSRVSVSTIDTGDVNNFSTVVVGDHAIIVYCFARTPTTKITQQPMLVNVADMNIDNKVNFAHPPLSLAENQLTNPPDMLCSVFSPP